MNAAIIYAPTAPYILNPNKTKKKAKKTLDTDEITCIIACLSKSLKPLRNPPYKV